MKFEDDDFAEVIETDYTDWKELEFTCKECESHKLVKCLGGQVVYALVDKITYKPEEYVDDEEYDEDESEDEEMDLEEDVADACVSVQTRPDGTELWEYGVDDANDFCSWFQCYECDHVLQFEEGEVVEDDSALARWILMQKKKAG